MMWVFFYGRGERMTFEYFFSNSELKLAVFREGVPEIMCDFSNTLFSFYEYSRNRCGYSRSQERFFDEFLVFLKFWGEIDLFGEVFLRGYRIRRDFEINLGFDKVVDRDELFYFERIFNRIREAYPLLERRGDSSWMVGQFKMYFDF